MATTPIQPGQAYGFFTDTSVCIGCKACEVACKEWNQLQGDSPNFLADSFDNTGSLDAQNWRHVQFIEHVPDESATPGNGSAWLMMSDVCKHCKHASCMEVCPTGAIIRTEFDTVYGGLNAFFLLMDKPETYGLPNADNARLPSRNDVPGYLAGLVTAVVAVVAGLVAFRRRVIG